MLPSFNHKIDDFQKINPLLIAALNASRQPITIADATAEELPLIFVNAAFLELTQYSYEEVIGRNCRFLQGPDTDPTSLANMRKSLAEGMPTDVKLLNYKKNGETFWNHLSMSPVQNEDGDIIAFIGLQHNINQVVKKRRRLFESDKYRSLSLMADRISAEIRQHTETAIESIDLQDLSEQHPDIQKVVNSFSSLDNLADKLSYFAQAEHEEKQVVNFHEIVKQTIELLGNFMPKGIQLRHKFLSPVPQNQFHVLLNKTSFQSVMLSLCLNAAESMNNNGLIDIEITYEADQAKVKIKDHGRGIDIEKLPNIFEPFFTDKAPGNGHGLGLAIARSTIAKWEGQIEILQSNSDGTELQMMFYRTSSSR